MPVRIAMVSVHANPLADMGSTGSCGQGVQVLELGTALATAGHDVTIWTRRDSAVPPDTVPVRPGVQVRFAAAGPVASLPKDDLVPHLPAFTRALEAAWALDRPDVVHAYYWMSGMVALAASDGRLPVVQTFHGLGSVKHRHLGGADPSPEGRVRAEMAVARSVDRVLAGGSEEVFELARLGTPRPRITVLPCGVDAAVFTPDGAAGTAARRSERHRVVVLGRLVPRKGVDDVIEALRRVPDTELVVAGGSTALATGPGTDVARLRSAAELAGVAGRVRLAGPVARAGVPALLRSADVVVAVPWYAPFGIVPLEAMACGRPVVASAAGGIEDTVVDQVTGLLVAPRRPAALAAALRAMLASPSRASACGIAGRDRVLARYDWERVAATAASVYADVIATRAGRAGVVAG